MSEEREHHNTGVGNDHYALTSPQTAIWLDRDKGNDPARYNICNVIKFDGPLDVNALHQAIVRTDQENDALRLRFISRNGEISQFFAAAVLPTDFSIVDLRFAGNIDASACDEVERFRARPLDPDNGIHCRHQVLQLGDSQYWWVRVYHHLVCDGYTGHLMAERVSEIYNAITSDIEVPASGFKPYRDFIASDAAYPDSAAYARDLAYWQDRLAQDNPVTRFSSRALSVVTRQLQMTQVISRKKLADIQRVAKQSGTSQTSVVMATFAILLAEISGNKKPTITLPLLNRIGRNERNMLGTFSCVVPFDVDLDKYDRFSDLAKNIFTRVRRDVRHIRLSPLRMRAAKLGHKSLSGNGAFFNGLEADTPLDFKGLEAKRVTSYTGPVTDIGLLFFTDYISPDQRDGEFTWQYDANRIDKETVGKIATRFQGLLDVVIANFECTPSAIITPQQSHLNFPGLHDDAPDTNATHQLTSCISPVKTASPDEQELAKEVSRVWQELIQIDAIAPNANLFEIGAHSLLVPRAQYAFSKLAGRAITSVEIFEYPTVEMFARHVFATQIAAPIRPADNGMDAAQENQEMSPFSPATPRLLGFSANTAPDLEQKLSLYYRSLYGIGDVSDVGDLTNVLSRQPLCPVRTAIIATDRDTACQALRDPHSPMRINGVASTNSRPVILLFPGQGSQRPGMARALYDADIVSAGLIDHACKTVAALSGPQDLRDLLLAPGHGADGVERLAETQRAQPALFIFEYALADYLMRQGVQPAALAGHSIGEYVAACLAGVMSFDDALRLVVMRGRLMQKTGPGAMYAVSMAEEGVADILALFGPDLSIASVNGPRQHVMAGSVSCIDKLESYLHAQGKPGRRLVVSHAFHSAMMDPILGEFRKVVEQTTLCAPEIPMQSNLSGQWLSDDDATNPDYWISHLRNAVRFADNIKGIMAKEPDALMVECGAGTTVSRLAAVNGVTAGHCISLQPAPDAKTDQIDSTTTPLLRALAKIWVAGGNIDFAPGHDLGKAINGDVSGAGSSQGNNRIVSSFAAHPAIEGQWLARRDLPVNDSYHIVTSVRLPRNTAFSDLQGALERVIARHETLRSTFVEREGELVQRVHTHMTIPLRRLDHFEDIRNGLFDLATGPLARFGYLEQSQTRPPLLAIAIDHLCFDGLSVALLEKEITTELSGSEPSVTVSARKLAEQARQDIGGKRGKHAQAFWQDRAEQLLAPQLSTDPLADNEGQGKRLFLRLTAQQADALATLTQYRKGATQTALWTALAIAVIARHKENGSAVLALPFGGRVDQDARQSMGCFANVLPLAITPDMACGLDDLVHKVAREILSVMDVQDYPLSYLTRDLSRMAQGPVGLPFDAVSIIEINEDIHDIDDVDFGAGKFPLMIAFVQCGAGAHLAIEYHTSFYGPAWIESFADRFMTLICTWSENPSQPLGRVEFLPAVEKQHLLTALNDTGSDYPRDCGLGELLSHRTNDPHFAGHIALDDGSKTITYRELGARLAVISQQLDDIGVMPGDIVGLAAERGIDSITMLLAIAWHGAAYLPIDKSLPAGAVGGLMSECGAQTLLCDTREYNRLQELEKTFRINQLPNGAPNGKATQRQACVRAGSDLAYVMFTSGSTGKPKGVMVPNRAVVRLVANNKALPFNEDDVVAQAASLGFDAATLEIWAAVLNGGRLCIINNDALFDPEALQQAVAKGGISTMWVTASLFNRIADEAPGTFASLTRLLSGGETLSPVHLRKVRTACPNLILMNGYGPTENTTFTCLHTITDHDITSAAIPIGTPIGNTRVYILDARGEIAPINCWGELHAAGDGLARGYTGAPERTGKAFIQVAALGSERLYKTGDRARWRADGVIEFGGRNDGQIKIRGHRIELGAIEQGLVALDDIRNACVLPVGTGADAVLGAAIAADNDERETWTAMLAGHLPAYMVPERIVVLDHLPVTANGKVDRRKLREILSAAPIQHDIQAISVDAAEQFIIRQFKTLFGARGITPGSDFFALGGHSLIAMRLAGLIEEETGFRPKLQDIFSARTVANLAQLVAKGQGAPAEIALSRVQGNTFPLSSGQARLWVLQRMQPDLAVYSVPATLEINGAIDISALQHALTALEERQHALRLRFRVDPDHIDGVSQYLAPSGGWKLRLHNMDAETARYFVAQETLRPFDLDNAPMARADLITLAPDRHWLMISLHHAICDGWSMPTLLRELSTFYKTATGATAPALPGLKRHYEDFANWQKLHLTSNAGIAAIARWKNRLLPLPEPLNLPTDHTRPAERRFDGDFLDFEIDADTATLVARAADHHGTTAFNILTALVQVLLYRHCDQTDISLGMLTAGREHGALDDVIGFFVNTVPLRQNLDPQASFATHLAQTCKTVMDAQSDQAIPFETIVNAVKTPRDLSRNPLFDVLVAWQDALPEMGQFGNAELSLVESRFPYAKFDLGFYFWRKNGALCGQVEFDTALFDRATIHAFVARLNILCRDALASENNTPIARLAVMPDAERVLIDQFNTTRRNFAVERSIPAPFLDQVHKTPTASAVIDDGEELTYVRFARRAAGIAARLQAASVGPGDVVGIAVRRSVNMLAAIYGTLLAGAAYSPLDPDHPAQRRQHMLEDLGAAATVVTTTDCAELFAGHKTVLIDGCEEADLPELATGPDDLAYVLFTSGSTGRPKGVEIAHRGVLNRILWMQDAFPIGPKDVILQKTPITFDVSVWELFWWSWTGAKVVLPTPGAERDPQQIADAICQHQVTTIHFVPSMLATFLFAVESGMVDINKLSSLKRVFASGEALDSATVRRFNALLYARFGTELHNLYGPTEATVDVTWQACSPHETGAVVPIGKPIANTTVQILDPEMKALPIGVTGEIILGGVQIARGYRNRPELSAEKFPTDPKNPGDRLYRTGDLGRWRRDGTVEYLGRIDHQVKIRGFRIECGEVEIALESHPLVERAPVKAVKVGELDELHAFILGSNDLTVSDLRDHLRQHLPEYMIPARFFTINHLPQTSSGKVDRKALSGLPMTMAKRPPGSQKTVETVVSGNASQLDDLETQLCAMWQEVLPGIIPMRDDGFFELGGNSLLLLRLFEKIDAIWPGKMSIADLFANPSIARQAEHLLGQAVTVAVTPAGTTRNFANNEPIAVIGMGIRIAGADDFDCFWQDIAAGKDLVRPLPALRDAETRDLLAVMGRPVPHKFREAAYLDDIFEFDTVRFRMAPVDAGLLDPEQRLFMETALTAIEDAGYGGNALRGQKVGVFAGGGANPVWRVAMEHLPPDKAEQAFALNVPSNIVTRLSFVKDWHGPAHVIDTACSSSLVAIHHACQNLRDGSCSIAIAGGAKLLPCPPDATQGFTIDSSTARTRAFDENADGTGMGEGSVIFVLKPMSAALQDGDNIHAVIRGSAVNQDGTSSGAAAPNPAMQADVIGQAALAADIDLASLSYFEAHGTGTALGDPIEIDGLTRAFAGTDPAGDPAFIGSGKGNYGHLDGAAGALGLARAIMVLQHDQAPPQPFFHAPNKKINFLRAPVRVSNGLAKLPDRNTPRRAGVSSFGLSGINAHIIIEAAPAAPKIQNTEDTTKDCFIVAISAGNPDTLQAYGRNLLHKIAHNPELAVRDIAFTLALGRDALKHRFAVAVNSREELLGHLEQFVHGHSPSTAIASASASASASVINTGTVDAVVFNEVDAQSAIAKYLAGALLSWPVNYRAQRISLPPSPFVKKICKPEFAVKPATTKSVFQGAIETATAHSFAINIQDPAFWPVNEHKLNGQPTLVGMAVPALIAQAVIELGKNAGPVKITALSWHHALVAGAIPDGKVTLSLGNDGRAELGGRLKNGQWRVFASADWQQTEILQNADILSQDLITAKATVPVQLAAFTGQFGAISISSRWDCIVSMSCDSARTTAIRHLRLQPDYHADLQSWLFHPALADAACSMALGEGEGGLLPIGIDQITVYGGTSSEVVACGELQPSGSFDVTLFDAKTGQAVLAVKGIRFGKLRHASDKKSVELLKTCWTPAAFTARALSHDCLFITDGDFWSLPENCRCIHPDTLSSSVFTGVSQTVLALSPGTDAVRRTAGVLRNILRSVSGKLRLVVLGHGAFATGDDVAIDPDQTAAAAIVLAVAHEEPRLSICYADIAPDAVSKYVAPELATEPARDPIAVYRNNQRYIRNLQSLDTGDMSGTPTWPDHGVCVVTGGTGGFGLALAGEMAAGGKVALAFVGRRAEHDLDEDTKKQIRSLRHDGIEITVFSCDVADDRSLDVTLATIRATLGPITAVAHAAGIADGGFLAVRDMAGFENALLAKIAGVRNLDRLTLNDPVQAFVLFGSLTAMTGAAGQSAYCAANGFLDGFAIYRRQQGRPATVIDWCTLAEQGMAARNNVALQAGAWITPAEARTIWRSALSCHQTQITILDPKVVNAAKPQNPAQTVKSLSEKPPIGPAPDGTSLVAAIWAETLGYETVDSHDDFFALGGDSITGMQIIDRINTEFDLSLSISDLFSASSVAAISGLAGINTPAKSTVSDPDATQAPVKTDPISKISRIWAETLGYDVVEPGENFYALGGDSITGMQIVDRISRELGYQLNLTDLFENATIASLGEKLFDGSSDLHAYHAMEKLPVSVFHEAPAAFTHRAIVTIGTQDPRHAPAAKKFPVAPEQLSVLNAAQKGNMGTAFNLPHVFLLDDTINLDQLRHAIRQLVLRHEILRTRILTSGDTWEMEVMEPDQVLPDLVPIRIDSPLENALDGLVTPFDIEDGLPVRWKFLLDQAGQTALFFDIHHVLADGFTTERLFSDLFELYRGQILPPLKYQLSDYAWWSHQDGNQTQLNEAKEYWQSIYQGALPTINLPADRRRPAYHTFKGEITTFEIDPELLSDARKFAARQRVTMFTLILSTWFAVLSRLAETDDLVISVPVDSRDATGFRDVPGMMVSLLPLRMQIDDGETVKSLLAKMQTRHVESMRHRAYFLDKLLDDLSPPAAPDRTLLSEISLSYMNYQASPAHDNAHIRPLGLMRHHCKNDLAIFIRDLPDSMSVSFDYYADLFDRSRMEDLGRIFTTSLRRLIHDDAQQLARMDLLPTDQAANIKAWENGPDIIVPQNRGLYSLFAQQATTSPDRCAVRDATGTWTYAQLMSRAGEIAHHLETSGIKQGDLVALHIERGREAIASILGIAALGAGYVPLDSAYPADRNRFILADSAARLVLVDDIGKDSLGDLAGLAAKICPVADISGSDASFTAPDLNNTDQSPAYLMYTSGSTGKPKGVLIEQRAVIGLVAGADYVNVAPGDVIAQAGPLAFDAATFEIWVTLLHGGQIAVIDRNTLLDPALFGTALTTMAVTTMFMSVGLFNRQTDYNAKSLAGLKNLMIGGDNISKSHVRKCLEMCPDTRLFNVYGPTESTTFAAVCPIVLADLRDDTDFTVIGRPIAHTRTVIYDPQGVRTPVGVWGELWIGGNRLAREYWCQPALTAEKFVADPDRAGGRFYRTGDFARWTRDGRIEFGGRRDNQIKLRGFRIELDEIEQQLQTAPFVRNAVALFNPNGLNGGEIIACVQQIAGNNADNASMVISKLQRWVGTRLPGYMVPTRWHLITDIPITANGKVDRKILLEQVRTQSPAALPGLDVDAVLSPAEQIIADIFSDVFQVPVQDRNVGFAALGGHSLMAIRIVNRIADRTGNRFSMADFFANPTIAALARHLNDMKNPDGDIKERGIPTAPKMDHYPVSHAQKRLYLLSRMDGNSGAYGMLFVLRCNGTLRGDILQQALMLLTKRHETLRTEFQEHDGIITQRIHPVTAPIVKTSDVSSHASPAREALRLTREEAANPVTLDCPPLIRAHVITVATNEQLLVLGTHHIVGDGWSSRVVLQELGVLYQAALHEKTADLVPLPISYKDFAFWQTGQEWSDAAAYWQEKLTGAPDHIKLPTDRKAPEVQSYRGAHAHLEIEPDVLRGLHKLAETRKTTLSAVGLALFSAVLYRLTRQKDMVIGMGVAGRERTETEGLIGFFVNVLPIRVQLDETTELTSLITELHGNIVAALDRQDYPFDELVRAVAPKRHSNRQPLINVVFEYQRFGDLPGNDQTAGLPLLAAGQAGILPTNLDAFVDNTTAKHDLILFLAEEADQARFTLEYDTDLFDAETMQRWLAFLGKFASAAAQDI
ncbi:non-ribosomal peptide synthetase/type I polyketide synthase [Thalassospira mesophila]|uniref:Uncharacterized protein n=1 Tax=Thalassospira mesophila TaxID=1293891 RepID=A0A1Y2KWZ5_9PROT|nr:non-ribosomal peptide synthetase/type I polyketide synthase [Thalassospira mesophila]OSQ36737.1 hypothetical protein TMES_16795 [Thalassospira mesophila]